MHRRSSRTTHSKGDFTDADGGGGQKELMEASGQLLADHLTEAMLTTPPCESAGGMNNDNEVGIQSRCNT